RTAVERHAMKRAIAYYKKEGFAVTNTSAHAPYDLKCVRRGTEVRVEVKGTSGDGSEVEVTAGEVENARGDAWRTDLFIVRKSRTEAGRRPPASGGVPRRIKGWCPSRKDLIPTNYRCRVAR